METTPVKSPVTYKRRRSGTPLSELRWNASDVDVDPESAVSLLAYDEGLENVITGKKSRKRLSDEPLPRRQTRSSTTPVGESITLKDKALKVIGASFGKKVKERKKEKGKVVERTPAKDKENVKGKGIERTPRKDTEKDKGKGVDRTPTPRKQASYESPLESGPGLWQSPIEFVMEKRAMFKEIDDFVLESEEEEPEEQKTTGIQMLSDSSGETLSLESSKGETSVEPPNMRPEQSTAISTEELSKGETSAQPPNTRPEQGTQELTPAEAVSTGERAVQTPITRLDQSTEEVTITAEVEEKDDGS